MLIMVLAALSALAPLAIDMYVPAFPEMASTLGASSAAIQLSMTACLIGLVVGQLVIGPLSDSMGRRRPLLAGTLAFVIFSIAAALAPTAEILTATRFLQGIAGAAGMVIARALLTDKFHGPALAQKYTVLSMVIGVAPVIAPIIGGTIITTLGSWRTIFYVLAALGALLFIAILIWVDETLPADARMTGGLKATLSAMSTLLRNRTFMGYVATLAAASAGLFAYISGSSFVFQEHYGVSAGFYSMIFAVNALAMVAASFAFGRFAQTVSIPKLLLTGTLVSLAGALAQVIVDVTTGGTLATTWIFIFITQLGVAWVTAGTMTIGQTLARGSSGAGSALLGGGQFTLGAIAAPIVGLFGTQSPLPMATIMLIAYAAALLSLVLIARMRHH